MLHEQSRVIIFLKLVSYEAYNGIEIWSNMSANNVNCEKNFCITHTKKNKPRWRINKLA